MMAAYLHRLILTILVFASLIGVVVASTNAQSSTEWSAVQKIDSQDPEIGFIGYTELVSDSQGRLHAFWEGRPFDASPDSRIFYTFLDPNQAWRSPIDILPSGRFPSVHIDSYGVMHLFASGACLFHSAVQLDLATDPSKWMQAQQCIGPNQISQFGTFLDANDILHVVYNTQGGNGLEYIFSTDFGLSWSSPSTVATSTTENQVLTEAAIVVDPDGRIHITWTSYPVPEAFPPLGIEYSYSDNGIDWITPVRLSEDYNLQSQLLEYNGSLHVIWNGALDRSERYHRASGDAGVSWDAIAPWISVAGGILGHPDGVFDQAGNLHAVGATDVGLWYNQMINGVWQTPRSIALPELQTSNPSIALVLDNQLHVIFLTGALDVWHTQVELPFPQSSPIPYLEQQTNTAAVGPPAASAPSTTDLTETVDENATDGAKADPVLGASSPRATLLANINPLFFGVAVSLLWIAIVVGWWVFFNRRRS